MVGPGKLQDLSIVPEADLGVALLAGQGRFYCHCLAVYIYIFMNLSLISFIFFLIFGAMEF